MIQELALTTAKARRCHALSHVLVQKQKQPRDGVYM
jgi:hypothetical protein